jgi:predicted site-specific integrase-resolvase
MKNNKATVVYARTSPKRKNLELQIEAEAPI